MIGYHLTTTESAEQLKTAGASAEWIGKRGGFQAGRGFYLMPDRSDANYWQHRIGGDVLLSVDLSAAKIADAATVAKGLTAEGIAWAQSVGLVTEDRNISDQVYRDLGLDPETIQPWNEDEAIWSLFGSWMQALDFDGYQAAPDTIVITNWTLLSGSAFSAA